MAIQSGVPSDDVLSRVWELKAAGTAIDAIKELRQFTGRGLKEAMDFVDAMTGPSGHPPATDPHSGGLALADEIGASQHYLSQVWELKAAGRTIDAIKELGQFTGWGLKEAKDFVDAMTEPHQPEPSQAVQPESMTGTPPFMA